MSDFTFPPFLLLKHMDPSDPAPLFLLWDIHSVLCLTITLQKATAIYVDAVEWFQHVTWPNHTIHGYILRDIFFSCRETFPSIFEKSHINIHKHVKFQSVTYRRTTRFHLISLAHSILLDIQLPSTRYTQISVLKAGPCIQMEIEL